MNTFKKVAAVVIAVVLFASAFSITAAASTQSIELETRSILLVDYSGSIEDRDAADALVLKLDTTSYDAVGYFDTEVSADESFTGGGNSSICEAIDQAVSAGFTHISVITDGQQWPADYSSLGLYTDINLTIHLVEEEASAADELIGELESRLNNSSLKVVTPEGQEQVVLDDYQATIYTIEIPDGSSDVDNDVNNEGDTFIEKIKEGYFPWWLILLIAVMIAALFDFIHELITRRRVKEKETQPQQAPATPAPIVAPAMTEATIASLVTTLGEDDVEYYVDISTSFENVFDGAAEAALKSGIEYATVFGSEVKKVKTSDLANIVPQGKTKGWEALSTTSSTSEEKKDAVLLSDLKFNGKPFSLNDFNGKKFKKITVYAPKGYASENLEKLKKISDEVEVLPL